MAQLPDPVQVPGGVAMFARLGLVQRAGPGEFAAAAGRVAIFQLR